MADNSNALDDPTHEDNEVIRSEFQKYLEGNTKFGYELMKILVLMYNNPKKNS